MHKDNSIKKSSTTKLKKVTNNSSELVINSFKIFIYILNEFIKYNTQLLY